MKIPEILLKIAVSASEETCLTPAKKIALELNLPFIIQDTSSYDYVLLMTPSHLCLKKPGSNASPLMIDFLSEKFNYRKKQISFKNEILARALGLKKLSTPSIVDATGGLARDSFIIASLGFQIQILERSPIIHALLADGLMRGIAKNEDVKRLHLTRADAVEWLETHEKPDIIYLDPMFPPRKKSALPKQEMLIFHDIVGTDRDADRLFHIAFACATKRVVVKRPRLASYLAGITPSFSYNGRSCRFDVYLT